MDIRRNLANMLEVLQEEESKGVTHIYGDDNEIFISYKDLYKKALNILYNLQKKGIKKGDELIFQINDNITHINVFWGCILGGIIPIPVSVGNNHEHRAKLFKIWNILNNPYIISDSKVFTTLEQFAESTGRESNFEIMRNKSIDIEQIHREEGEGTVYPSNPEEIAFIQFSSGSTGDPKGVVLTHENLLTNIDGMTYSAGVTEKDSFLTWMPLTHDMGMIGFHLWPLCVGINHFIIPTTVFIRRPSLWMKKVHEHKADVLSSPNFGYGFFLNSFKEENAKDWDLSHIRILFNGAEPISIDLCERFLNTLKKFGIKREAMLTVYGLAEASLGAAFPPYGKEYEKIIVDRHSLGIGQKVRKLDEKSDKDAVELAIEGNSIKHCFIRICDDQNNRLPPMVVGNIHISGKNVTHGYYNNQKATDSLITEDGWVNTGDLGFVDDRGQLVITGRAKDIIFVRGQNYYPHDIEGTAMTVPGVDIGKVAACGVYDSDSSSEEIIVCIWYKRKIEEFAVIAKQVKKTVNEKMGLVVKHVVPVREIPKTTSGKVQRYKLSELFKEGAFTESINLIENIIAGESLKTGNSVQAATKEDISAKNPENIQDWLINKIAEEKKLEIKKIGLEEPFSGFGLDSINIVKMAADLSEWLGKEIAPTLIYDYGNIKSLSIHLAGADIGQEKDESRTCGNFPSKSQDVAIVGIGCRFPGASNADEFWNMLVNGTDAITEVPSERVIEYTDGAASRSLPKWGGFIENIDEFDPLFFGISPREAESMDPQQRILLEVCWEAFEHAGINIKQLKDDCTGVFIGISNSEYGEIQEKSQERLNAYYGTGNAFSVDANRISYMFNFQGPSLAIDTACSSSLVAVHYACGSLRDGECDVAVAGGVNLILTDALNIAFQQAGMLSEDGRCKTFDKSANGYARGEGCGVVILKPLEKAVKDNDTIYAVIKGTAINHNGKSSGLTVPNGLVQQKVIRKALDNAGVLPGDVGYIEAHGTGTALGDPIEFQALKNVFAVEDKNREACYIGSVKTNIGHLEAAAGIAGLIKTVLSLHYEKIPPHLHLKEINPLMNMENTDFVIPTAVVDWKPVKKRIAGVSSFGFGGSNAHVVLEEYEKAATRKSISTGEGEIVILSANDRESLIAYAGVLRDYLRMLVKNTSFEISLSEIAYTLKVGRVHMPERLGIIAYDIQDLYTSLNKYLLGEAHNNKLFTGNCSGNNLSRDHFLIHEEGKEYLKLLVKNRNYRAILQLWVSGIDVDWSGLYTEELPRKVALPTYPFRRERYWIENDKIKAKSEKNQKDILFLKKAWKDTEENIITYDAEIRHVLFIINDTSRTWIQKITSMRNNKITFIHPDDPISSIERISLGEHAVIVDFSDIGDYPENTEKELKRIAVYQAIIRNYSNGVLKILHFTLNRQRVQQEDICINGTLVSGFIKMLAAEYGKVYAKTIDLTAEYLPRLNEICRREAEFTDNISEVCYRKGKRRIPFLKTVEKYSHSELSVKHSKYRYDLDRAVVITGGTGGIGLVLASHLVRNGIRKLVLMGRKQIPERDQWEKILSSQEADSGLVSKIKAIIELEKAGAGIKVYSGSLVKSEEIGEYFAQVRNQWGSIGGIIHCAGLTINDHPAFIHKSAADIQAVLEPKVDALKILHKEFKEDKPDFFVVFSSVSAVIPGLATGISDYSAANYYMDTFVNCRIREGYHYYKSINWPGWSDVGMGARGMEKYENYGLCRISPDLGLKIWDLLLEDSSQSSTVVMKVDSDKFVQETLLCAKNSTPEVKAGNNKVVHIKESPNTWVSLLKTLFSEELKIPPEKLGENDDFGRLGVDSIILAEMVKKIEKRLNIVLEPSVFWEYPSINAMAGYLNSICTEKPDLSEVEESPEFAEDQACCILEEHTEEHINTVNPSKIAVVGVACRFPGAENKDEFWSNLKSGKDSITQIPPERWDIDEYFSEDSQEGKSISKWGGFIDKIEEFDPSYFGINKNTAKQTDPLIRLFLEASAAVVQDAGYEKKELSGKKVGVFAGSRISSYSHRIQKPTKDTVVAAGQNFIAAHVSHFMNLKGPSMVVDTACSSSLVGIHLACQSLLSGETEMCIAGGVDLLLDERVFISLSQAGALSPDGKCHTFDKSANGFVPGEGCGAVLLKPLEKALADGDRVYAVIDASAVNNDGNTMGITTPNFQAQMEVIDDAIRKSGVDAETISYIETHGTGTLIGDPIELKALTSVFRKYTKKEQFCGIGSVKTNIGHLLSAAGIAGFIKVILCIWSKQIAPSINCNVPNPRFNFEDSPFYIANKLQQWAPVGGIRRAGISAFGFGGTNAHIIVSDMYPKNDYQKKERWDKLEPVTYAKETLWIDKQKKQCGTSQEPNGLCTVTLKTRTDNTSEFEVIIDKDNYIVRDHRVHGVRIVPGVTFIDFIYRALEIAGLDSTNAVLYNILFKSPVSTSELFEREIRIKLSNQENSCNVTAKSRKIFLPDREKGQWEENLTCEVSFRSSDSMERISIDTLKAGASEILDADEAYKYTRSVGIEHFEFMKPSGKIYMGRDYLLAELELGTLAQKYTRLSYFHPAFLDASSIVSFMFQYQEIPRESRQTYIPVFIEGFRGHHKTKDSCYVYVEKDNTGTSSDDLMYSAMKIADETGNIIAEFRGFTTKKIREKDLITKLEKLDAPDSTCVSAGPEEKASTMPGDMKDQIMQMVSAVTGIPASDIDSKASFYDLGLDSTDLLQMVHDIEKRIGATLYPTLLFEYSSIEELCSYLEKNNYHPVNEKSDESNIQQKNDTYEIMYFERILEKTEQIPEEKQDSMNGVLIFDCTDNIHYQDEKQFFRLLQEKSRDKSLPDTFCYILSGENRGLPNKPEENTEKHLQEIYPLFYLCKALQSLKIKKHFNILVIYKSHDDSTTFYSALSGLFRSMRLENGKLGIKLIETDIELWAGSEENTMHVLENLIRDELAYNDFNRVKVKYLEGKRYVEGFREISLKADIENGKAGIRENGVYIIAGGAGGIGLILSKYLTRNNKVRLVLLGRSELGREKECAVNEMIASGSEVIYRKADITDLKQVQFVFKETLDKWGAIHGVINCAGVHIDNLIENKSIEEIKIVLDSKVKGTICLDEVSKSLELDYFILFSSLSAIVGNIGQTDYAYANSFLDNFASWRDSLCKKGKRSGRTLSVNWPLWENGGMQVNQQTKEMFADVYGMKPLDNEAGMNIFSAVLGASSANVVAVLADRQKFEKLIEPEKVSNSKQDDERKEAYYKLLKELDGNLDCRLLETEISSAVEVIQTGEGRPLLLLSAFGMTGAMWYYQLRELRKKYRLVIVNIPGHGKSKPIENVSLEKLSLILKDVLGKLGIKKPVPVIGASFGGMIAQDFAARFPDNLSKMILVSSFSQTSEGFRNMTMDEARRVFNQSGKEDMKRAKVFNESSEEECDRIYYKSQHMNPIASISYMKALQRLSTSDTMKNIKIPTLIITGAHDKFEGLIFNIGESDFIAENIYGSKRVVLDNAGHFPHITLHKSFNKIITDYLECE